MPRTITSHFQPKRLIRPKVLPLRRYDGVRMPEEHQNNEQNGDSANGQENNHNFPYGAMFRDDLEYPGNAYTRDLFEGLAEDVANSPDNVLQFVTAACIGRFSQSDFDRLLLSYDGNFETMVQNLWNQQSNSLSIHYFCNGCGAQHFQTELCCGKLTAKFVRLGIKSQLHSIVNHYLQNILDIREGLKRGEQDEHNLNSPFFRRVWERETESELLLSGVLSVDGVCVPGNTKKLWPITLMLVDLPTAAMQKSSNIILEGIVESTSNPTTTLWNSLLPMIRSDCEGRSDIIKNYVYKMRIVTLSADQPAKRSIFGMKSHQSSLSCFFCLAPGTFYKEEGQERAHFRAGNLTSYDSQNCLNGFGSVPATILQIMCPFETPIDVLHDLGEGICETISREVFSNGSNTTVKSTLFKVRDSEIKQVLKEITVPTEFGNIEERRNGTDKLNFFRLSLAQAAINGNFMTPEARITIVAIALVVNKMYSNAPGPSEMDHKLCSAARWFLRTASVQYLSCKTHEVLFHLPYANRLFGNIAPLSTFSFESSYQYFLMGFSSRLTRTLCETACKRVLLQNTVRKELEKRGRNNPSPRIRKFLSKTSNIVPRRYGYYNVISPSKEFRCVELPTHCRQFSTLSLLLGTLHSKRSFLFAAENKTKWTCYRFIAAIWYDDLVAVLAEKFTEIDRNEQFLSLKEALQDLNGRCYDYGTDVLAMVTSFQGIKHCKPSAQMKLIPVDSIKSIATCFEFNGSYCMLASNGIHIHN